MSSSEFYEIFKNTFFTEHLWATASVMIQFYEQLLKIRKEESMA